MGAIHETRLIGRGGQGVVTAGDLLGAAAVNEGRWAQSIPTFGPERRGALCSSTLRIGDDELLLKCAAAHPDVVVVLDPTVWRHANLLAGLSPGATLVFNTPKTPTEIAAELFSGPTPTRPGPQGVQMAIASVQDGAALLWSMDVDEEGGEPLPMFWIYTVDATAIALETLGRPITNTAMMGAFVGATGLLGMDAVLQVIEERFGARAEGNLRAARGAAEALCKLEA